VSNSSDTEGDDDVHHEDYDYVELIVRREPAEEENDTEPLAARIRH
jgi:hypothetical protein